MQTWSFFKHTQVERLRGTDAAHRISPACKLLGSSSFSNTRRIEVRFMFSDKELSVRKLEPPMYDVI